ncbi:MAG: hypothetical protein AABY15_03600 [Nanoarchaeota archaeon]|jgi:hypothetical protein
MESVLETDEKVLLERELNELLEVTFRMEYELELTLKEAGSR